ncbi:MAG: PQQ-binding-like beta-propeller repeat protein [Planctomycetia bacterium]|nr:PQQ-binding-like beta-propeller repeat protein [Planctomycetia bacterium]
MIWLTILTLLPAAASAGDWTQFRGPRGDGLVEEGKLPERWSEQSNVAWKVALPGRGWSQPIVAGNKIFITTAVSDQEEKPRRGEMGITPGAADSRQHLYRWKVLCLAADSGDVVWEKTVHEGKPKFGKHRTNTYASETPATDGEVVVAYFGMTGIWCFDLEGNQKWTKDLGAFPTQANWGTGSSPVIHDNAVFVQCDNEKSSFLVALDKRTGDELWRKPRDEKTNWSTPYLWKNKVRTELVAAGGRKMRSYAPDTGDLLWEMEGSGRTSLTPVGNDEMLYVDSVASFQGSPGRLAAIRAGADGDISLKGNEKSSDAVAWSIILNSYRNASPLLYADCLYMVEQHHGVMRCYDARTGKVNYQMRLPEATGCNASPWVMGNRIHFLDEVGLTVIFTPGPEFHHIVSNKLEDEMFWASAAVSGDRLFLRSIQHLYCIRDPAVAAQK